MIIFLIYFVITTAFAAPPTCQARYDQLKIPHQEVGSLEDLYYCFGLHHGSDRAWQMDYFRRVALGTNAEVLGYEHLKSDLMMRLLDLPGLTRKIWGEFSTDQKKFFQLYADGVNAGFKAGGRAAEFKELGYHPEPWQPQHSLMVLLLQSFDQTRRTFFQDYEEERFSQTWGDEAPELFSHENVPWMNTILKEGEYPKKAEQRQPTTFIKNPLPRLWANFPSLFGEAAGSNNWVVSKEKSSSGYALLANDPHLDLKTPLFWYWIHLKSPQHEIIGASLPGVPLIASGTNGKVAWGLTNAYINTADAVFVEDAEQVLESIRPVVWVKFWFFKLPFFFKSFSKTAAGHPELPLEVKRAKKILLRWSGFHLKAADILPMLELFKAEDVTAMDEILKSVGVPAWNFVFADTSGEIGFRAIGKSYKHEDKLPFGIPVMSYEQFTREAFLSSEEMPHLLRPGRHYIYTANNRHWPLDAAFYGGRGYSPSFRGYRIDQLLQGKHDVESFKKIQCDREVIDAGFFRNLLVRHLISPELENWNFNSFDTTTALPLYRRLMDLLMEQWQVNEYALYRLLNQLSSEKHKELMDVYALAKAEVGDRDWGQIHKVGFFHLSRNGEWIFSPEISGVGDNQTVDPGTAKWNAERRIYEQNAGASMRMIIEMSQPPAVHLCLPGLNREYTNIRNKPTDSSEKDVNPWEDWRMCRYTRVNF
jgi:acyl-homoserine lactone acylase PvdQ